MSSTLDDLFQQIIQSEERAQRRKSLLNEVKAEIENYQLKIKENQEETETLKGKVVLKTQQLNNEELNLKWLTTREEILRTQIKKFNSELQSLEKQLSDSENKLLEEYENFCSEVREFTKGYSLVENGQVTRREEANKQLALVLKEKDRLENDLQAYNEQKCIMASVEEEKEVEIARLDFLLSDENDLKEELKRERDKVESLLRENKQVSEIPHQASEFIELQEELEACKTENFEKRCQELKLELQKLKQFLWQKQLLCQEKCTSSTSQQTALPSQKNVMDLTSNFSSTNNNSTCHTQPDKSSAFQETNAAAEICEMANAELDEIFCEDLTYIPPKKSAQ